MWSSPYLYIFKDYRTLQIETQDEIREILTILASQVIGPKFSKLRQFNHIRVMSTKNDKWCTL